MPTKLTADAKGIYVIATTPFLDDGRIDFDSIDRLVDFYLKCGVHGMTVLGVMGEFQKLAESETSDVAARFIKRAGGRIPTIVGVSNPGTSQLVIDADRRVVVGATFVGPGVQEMLHAATIAIAGEVTLEQLWHAVPAFPTVSEVWLRLLEAYGL